MYTTHVHYTFELKSYKYIISFYKYYYNISLQLIAVDATGPLDTGFRWVQINSVRIYSVYYSPNVTLAEYNIFLNRLETSVRGSDGPVLIAGDFNAKRPEWGSPITNQRGNALAELASSLALAYAGVGL
jgi:hypothetical protein